MFCGCPFWPAVLLPSTSDKLCPTAYVNTAVIMCDAYIYTSSQCTVKRVSDILHPPSSCSPNLLYCIQRQCCALNIQLDIYLNVLNYSFISIHYTMHTHTHTPFFILNINRCPPPNALEFMSTHTLTVRILAPSCHN